MALTTNVLRAARDTYVGSTHPSDNHADAKQLQVSANDHALVWFNRSCPLGASIAYAKLRFYTRGSWGTTAMINVRRVVEHWVESRANWNNKPDVAASIAASVTQSSAKDGDLWEFDVTAAMQSVANGAVWYGFRLASDTTSPKAFYSSEAHDFKPELEIRWSEAPQQPTNLTPSGSQVVSIAKPVLQCDFDDRAGSTAMSGLQVQIDAGGNFTTPAFDFTDPDATEPELDLSATSYAGLSAGVETRWRVRVQDGSGLWSPYSDVVRFRRDNKGTLTITNPPVSGIISEWSPPIIWSLTGETQTAWQVFITPADDPGTRLWDSGRSKGADTSVTLPKGVIEDDNDYVLTVRIWDSKDRIRTATDKPWTEASRTFHFNEDPTPSPVTGLTVENLLPRPWVAVEWDRSTAPDSFNLVKVIDGAKDRVLDSGIDPADVTDSGTHYRYVYRDLAPFRTHELKVQSVVNGKTAGGPTASIEVRSQGIWIYDHDRDLEVFLAGEDDTGLVMGEEGTTHYPLGAQRGVRVTQSLRGYEGPITGVLVDYAGKTVDQWNDALMKMRGRPGRDCTVTLADESVRCIIHSISSAPTPSVPITKKVTFNIEQIGPLGYDVRW